MIYVGRSLGPHPLEIHLSFVLVLLGIGRVGPTRFFS